MDKRCSDCAFYSGYNTCGHPDSVKPCLEHGQKQLTVLEARGVVVGNENIWDDGPCGAEGKLFQKELTLRQQLGELLRTGVFPI